MNTTQRKQNVMAAVIMGAVVIVGAFVWLAVSQTGAHGPEGGEMHDKWVSSENSDVYLEFSEDDSVSGNDGCNGFSGTYAVDGDKVEFIRILGTKRGCIGVDTWLSGLRSAQVDGDALVIFDGDGQEIGRLESA